MPDLAEFTRVVSEQGRRIFTEMTSALRASGVDFSGDVSQKMDEAAARIDEQANRVAGRVQREVERAKEAADRAKEHAKEQASRHAGRAEEFSRRVAERMQRHAEHEAEASRRVAERVSRHAEREAQAAARVASGRNRRGRWWFTEERDSWWDHTPRPDAGRADATGTAAHAPGAGNPADWGASNGPRTPSATEAERLAILQMLQNGQISSEQAGKLLDALGG